MPKPQYDDLGFWASAETGKRYKMNRQIAQANQNALDWKQSYENLQRHYQQLERDARIVLERQNTYLDGMMAWRELAIEQAEEIRGKPFPPRGNPARAAEIKPLADRFNRIDARRTAARKAGRPEEY